MKTNNINPDEARLSGLLREARATPSLPPRFQQNVWRRIEDSELPAREQSWLDTVVALIFRPRLAFVFATALVLAGGIMGTKVGVQMARHDAEVRYVAAVAPEFITLT